MIKNFVADAVTFYETQATPFYPSTMTGAMVLGLEFDDSTDRLTARYSLNGGTSYTDLPFEPMDATGFTTGSWTLFADPIVVDSGAAAVPTLGPGALGALAVLLGLTGWLRIQSN